MFFGIIKRQKYTPHESTRYVNADGENLNIRPELYLKKENCCGCSACYSVCPMRAIQMQPDEEGCLYPVVDLKKCIGCQKCISVCAFKNDQAQKGFI